MKAGHWSQVASERIEAAILALPANDRLTPPDAPRDLLAEPKENKDLFGLPDTAPRPPKWRWFPEITEKSTRVERKVVSIVAGAYLQHRWAQEIVRALLWQAFRTDWDDELLKRQDPLREEDARWANSVLAEAGEGIAARYGEPWDRFSRILRGAAWMRVADVAGWTSLEMTLRAGGSGESLLPDIEGALADDDESEGRTGSFLRDIEQTMGNLLPPRSEIAP